MTTIRPSLPADLPAIYAIWLEGIEHSFAGFARPADLREQFAANFHAARPPFGFWVAEVDEQVVGWQSLLPCTSNPLKRQLLAESSTYVAVGGQGRGLGEPLLRYALAEAAQSGLQFVIGWMLVENRRMMEICRRIGFVPNSNALTPQVPPFTGAKELWLYTIPRFPAL